MAHNRKLVFGGVSLINKKMPQNIGLLLGEIRDEIEAVFLESEFLKDAPFKYIGIVFRFGLKDDLEPEIERPNKKHGDLPVGAEVDVSDFIVANPEDQKQKIRHWAIRAIMSVADKYNLPQAAILDYAKKKHIGSINGINE